MTARQDDVERQQESRTVRQRYDAVKVWDSKTELEIHYQY